VAKEREQSAKLQVRRAPPRAALEERLAFRNEARLKRRPASETVPRVKSGWCRRRRSRSRLRSWRGAASSCSTRWTGAWTLQSPPPRRSAQPAPAPACCGGRRRAYRHPCSDAPRQHRGTGRVGPLAMRAQVRGRVVHVLPAMSGMRVCARKRGGTLRGGGASNAAREEGSVRAGGCGCRFMGHVAGKRMCCCEAFVCSVCLCREQGRAVPQRARRG
jgi:hypothetical protein